MGLYVHEKHPHVPKNVNFLHREALIASGMNTRLAVFLTRHVGTMWAAYSFAVLAIAGLLAILGLFPAIVALLVVWVSQTFIQLVMLPILLVGQNVLGKHAELLAEEQFNTTQKSYHDIEQIMLHLSKQDEELLKQTGLLLHLMQQQQDQQRQRNVGVKSAAFKNPQEGEVPQQSTQKLPPASRTRTSEKPVK
jgi:hypothetical protein